jgi:phospholipase/carboxylesterase
MPSLTGPERLPDAGKQAESIVVMLHGRGGDGDNLIGLGDFFAPGMPSTAFYAPNAPYPFEDAAYFGGEAFGYQWYSRRTEQARAAGLVEVAPIVNAYIDELLATHKLAPNRCILLGFSQGCITSLHVAPRRKQALAGVVGFSGALVTSDTLPKEIANKAPIFLAHGIEDDVLPVSGTEFAATTLKGLGVPVESHILPGLGHSIDQRGAKAALAFMQRLLNGTAG